MKKPLRVPLSAGVTRPFICATSRDLHPPAGSHERRRVEVWESIHWTCGRPRQRNRGARGGSELSHRRADSGQYELAMASPGAYWISASANGTGNLPGRVTAGGKNLAYSPWIAGTLGTGAVIEAVVRTTAPSSPCQLPAGILAERPARILRLFVYLIPEFESAQRYAR